jgi:hypothetical protein
MGVELYAVIGTETGGHLADVAGLRFDGADISFEDVEFWGEYPTLADAVEAADAEGLGLWYTSTPADGGYTGMVRVLPGTQAEYRAI